MNGVDMNWMKRERAWVCVFALLLAGCVTINIYFPAAAAEKMADKIIDEVWQMQKEGTPKPPAAANVNANVNATGKENK